MEKIKYTIKGSIQSIQHTATTGFEIATNTEMNLNILIQDTKYMLMNAQKLVDTLEIAASASKRAINATEMASNTAERLNMAMDMPDSMSISFLKDVINISGKTQDALEEIEEAKMQIESLSCNMIKLQEEIQEIRNGVDKSLINIACAHDALRQTRNIAKDANELVTAELLESIHEQRKKDTTEKTVSENPMTTRKRKSIQSESEGMEKRSKSVHEMQPIQTNAIEMAEETVCMLNTKDMSTLDIFMDAIRAGIVYKPDTWDFDSKGLFNALINEFQNLTDTSDSILEAFGGTLCRILNKSEFICTRKNFRSLIDLCMKYTKVEYFVVCVLIIVTRTFSLKFRDELYSLHNMLISLTCKYDPNYPDCWSPFLFRAWEKFFDVMKEYNPSFLSIPGPNTKLLNRFLQLSRCKTMQMVLSSERHTNDQQYSDDRRCYVVRSHLNDADLSIHHEEQTCVEILYDMLHKHPYLYDVVSKVWTFVNDKNNKIIALDKFRENIGNLDEGSERTHYSHEKLKVTTRDMVETARKIHIQENTKIIIDLVEIFMQGIDVGVVLKLMEWNYCDSKSLVHCLISTFVHVSEPNIFQYEAFGGTICHILEKSDTLQTYIDIPDMLHLIYYCMKNPEIEYFVGCVLFIIQSPLVSNWECIAAEIYEMLVLFTKKYGTSHSCPLWSNLLFCLWEKFFQTVDMYKSHPLYSDLEVVRCFLKLSRCEVSQIISSEEYRYNPHPFVRDHLQSIIIQFEGIERPLIKKLYMLLQTHIDLHDIVSLIWTFAKDKEGRLINIKQFYDSVSKMEKLARKEEDGDDERTKEEERDTEIDTETDVGTNEVKSIEEDDDINTYDVGVKLDIATDSSPTMAEVVEVEVIVNDSIGTMEMVVEKNTIHKTISSESMEKIENVSRLLLDGIRANTIYKYGECDDSEYLLNVFVSRFQESFPTPSDQELQAFGGVLNYILQNANWMALSITPSHFAYLITLSMQHSELNYLVACILLVIKLLFSFEQKDNTSLVYEMLVFFTRLYDTKSQPRWSTFLLYAWEHFLCNVKLYRNHSFYADCDFLNVFFDLFRCTIIRTVFSTDKKHTTQLFFLAPPQNTSDYIDHEIGLCILYEMLVVHENLFEAASIIWDFVCKDAKIVSLQEFVDGVHRLDKDVTYSYDSDDNRMENEDDLYPVAKRCKFE
jgi:hypothetical protein